MRILVFSDLYKPEKVPTIECDLVVLLGNIAKPVVLKICEVYNNHNILGLHSNLCAADIYANTEVIDIHEKVVEIDTLRFAGFGGIPSYSNSGRGYYTEERCQAFVNKVAVSDIDVLFTYSNPAYGDLKTSEAKEGFKTLHEVYIKKLASTVIHGRLHENLKRRFAKIDTHMVYEYKLIKIENG